MLIFSKSQNLSNIHFLWRQFQSHLNIGSDETLARALSKWGPDFFLGPPISLNLVKNLKSSKNLKQVNFFAELFLIL